MIKKKIAVIGLKGIPAFGGAATVGEHLINELKDEYDFTVLSIASHSSKENTLVNGIHQKVFSNLGTGGLNTFYYYIRCLIHVLWKNYDMIHLHHAESGFITPLLRLKYKVIVTFHGIYNYIDPKFSKIHNWFFRFSERLNVTFANEIVSVSMPDVEFIKNKYGRDIHSIPNGINITERTENLLQIKNTKDYIFFAAGRIYEIKGLHLLLEAMKLANERTLLKVAGDINQVPDYKIQIEALSKLLNTEFLGMIKEKNELMKLVSEAKLFVFPSLTEAMSMMLLEVVSMKTPVIVSDIPSNKSIFSHEEVLFFKSNDSHDLMEKLQFANEHPELMKEKAEKAFQKLSLNYTWNNIGKQYDLLYQKLT
ncbi:MAG: glycosyltransferase family 4 protein [Bacteroidetes bacterium]|jgi:glycosyltransferase involved in cell wall biosynthesis|nr:glycosyltransferase family 4 protein [Bacteroidota bacterium]MBM3886566.1 glycosyltransferase family 4 protein [Candidatus Dependentiae bacterium]